jgi:hypothetical protein
VIPNRFRDRNKSHSADGASDDWDPRYCRFLGHHRPSIHASGANHYCFAGRFSSQAGLVQSGFGFDPLPNGFRQPAGQHLQGGVVFVADNQQPKTHDELGQRLELNPAPYLLILHEDGDLDLDCVERFVESHRPGCFHYWSQPRRIDESGKVISTEATPDSRPRPSEEQLFPDWGETGVFECEA